MLSREEKTVTKVAPLYKNDGIMEMCLYTIIRNYNNVEIWARLIKTKNVIGIKHCFHELTFARSLGSC